MVEAAKREIEEIEAAEAVKLHGRGAVFISKPGGARSQIVRDPDGHAMQLDEVSADATASAQR
jgi:hypothetical protein